jgi:hypothetical protein
MHDCPLFGHACVASQKRMHTGDVAVGVAFAHVSPGPQSVPAKFGRSTHASPSSFVPAPTHVANIRPASSSANVAQRLPPEHDDASKTSHEGAHPRLPLLSVAQTLFAPQSASLVHWHSPLLHVPTLHVPHEPPQPSLPHASPVHEGVHVAAHVPLFVLQVAPVAHVPHEPPQPSPPHARPAQLGSHAGGSGT